MSEAGAVWKAKLIPKRGEFLPRPITRFLKPFPVWVGRSGIRWLLKLTAKGRLSQSRLRRASSLDGRVPGTRRRFHPIKIISGKVSQLRIANGGRATDGLCIFEPSSCIPDRKLRDCLANLGLGQHGQMLSYDIFNGLCVG